jgi:hypothetical protein
MAALELTGEKFGKLTVIKRVENNSYRASMWLCKCDCGKTTRARGSSLKRGVLLSCGCQRSEHIIKSILKHGDYQTRLYNIWCKMRHRCEGQTNEEKIIKSYRERGIKVCTEWHDYYKFKEWALSNGYADNLSIDRIENNGDYCPENCRWTNSKTQMNNTQRCVKITYKGITKTLAQWSESLGIAYPVLRGRIQNSRWSVEKAFTEPVGKRTKRT